MSIPFWVQCTCGQETELIETRFPSYFWFDSLVIMKKYAIDAETHFGLDFNSSEGNALYVTPDAFDAWVAQCRETLTQHATDLPRLYHIWEREQRGLRSGSAYFWHEGRLMMVDTTETELFIVPIREDLIPRRTRNLTYEPPVAIEKIPGFKLSPSHRHSDRRPEYDMSFGQFNAIFQDTQLFVEVTQVPEEFERGARALEHVLLHARDVGESLHFTF